MSKLSSHKDVWITLFILLVIERHVHEVPRVLTGETKAQRPEFDSNFCPTRGKAFLHSTNTANEILL